MALINALKHTRSLGLGTMDRRKIRNLHVRQLSKNSDLREEVINMKHLIQQQQNMLESIMNTLEKKPGVKQDDNISTIGKEVNYAKPDSKELKKNPRGFQDFQRKAEPYRPPRFRLRDWAEINSSDRPVEALKLQAARCMDCGTPFCQTYTGCPINNLIPEWNALVLQDQWEEAYKRLAKTNNFPEFTGRVCPAPCEGACVAGILSDKEAVTIKNIEYKIIETAFENGWVTPRKVQLDRRTGKTVAVIGSGPAGLACADQLNQLGHSVTVFERAPIIGGLMHYGIPNMKIDKYQVARRVDLLTKEGVKFVANANIGVNVSSKELESEFDSVCLAIGATVPRALEVSGAGSKGVVYAMDFLTANQMALDNDKPVEPAFSAEGKNVIVVGGGDTGTDCISTSLRNYCKSLVNLELMPRSPDVRNEDNGYWPLYPKVHKLDYGHEEAEEVFGKDPRRFSMKTVEVVSDADNNVTGVKTVLIDETGGSVENSEKILPADLVLLAMGFVGPNKEILRAFDAEKDEEQGKYLTTKPGVFLAGDCRRGQSLVVWAINEGREAAEAIDSYLVHQDKRVRKESKLSYDS